ncbi:hypothetical protein EYC98_00720 [Halieaceae bacterium IMCC14734]|uniref:Uncharacterized protein n=1 Tax=Candidatus Litorirhabdus singularis TaxID=2518993 RepID=A0ABT3TC36_9GAMM|nr:hypothetical protein [Candidatus Litorirhabdus singularis]MCX2979381.1 hypothetical protein [Candidatus Litorirhabdus singularis]
MKTLFKVVTTSVLLGLSLNAMAAKPTSIVFESNGTGADGKEYSNYQVKCSNGKNYPLTAWDNRKKWCVGDETSEACEKKQIKAAKKACKGK